MYTCPLCHNIGVPDEYEHGEIALCDCGFTEVRFTDNFKKVTMYFCSNLEIGKGVLHSLELIVYYRGDEIQTIFYEDGEEIKNLPIEEILTKMERHWSLSVLTE